MRKPDIVCENCRKWEEYHNLIVSTKDELIAFNRQTERDVRRAEAEGDKLRSRIYDLEQEIRHKDEVIEQQAQDIVDYRNEIHDET